MAASWRPLSKEIVMPCYNATVLLDTNTEHEKFALLLREVTQ